MTCPVCKTENAEGSSSCVRCSSSFSVSHEAETRFDPAATFPHVPTHPFPDLQGGPSRAATDSAWGYSINLEPGTDFGPRYRIVSILGRGGMGAVYKAYDKDLDRLVALKLVRPDLAHQDKAMQRLKQELLLASKISNKNVLRIHDLGDVNGVKFISMAYVEGEDLQQRLLRQGRPDVDQAVGLARQLCSALAAAHHEGVVHRDLKPQNVLIDKAGTAYVSDFGLAKSLEEGGAMMTHAGELVGTPLYMSPEQVEGKQADARSDIYALGLVLYQMLTGEIPFASAGGLKSIYERLTSDPTNPKVLNPDLPNYLVRLVLKCLERDPARRYQSAQEILADLDPQSLSRSGMSWQNRPVLRVTPRRGLGWIVAAVLLLAIAIGLAIPKVRSLFFRPRPRAEAPAGAQGIPPLSQGKYVAVLPFRMLGDPSALGYVGEGIQESLSAKLFQLAGIHIADAEAVQKAEPGQAVEKVASQLGANLVVDGTIQQAGGRIAIVARLQDAANHKLLWSEEFPGTPQDLLALEDRIYARLVPALDLSPSSQELARSVHRPTENEGAYDDYLMGRDAMRGQQNPKNVEAAIDHFNAALAKDPRFALAYAGIANASLTMYSTTKDRFWTQKAVSAAQQALRLDDRQPEVHFTLGSVLSATGRTQEAIVELHRALDLAPNSDEVYRRLGSAYMANGSKDDAIQAFEHAVQINPYYWLNYNALGNAYFQLGDYSKALTAFSKVTELEPDNAWGYENIGAVHLSEGKYAECIPAFQKALELEPNADNYSNLGTAYFYLKRYDESVKTFAKAQELNPNDETIAGNLADAERWSGQKDKAQADYDKAIALTYKELEVNPRDFSAMEDLALYYAEKGNYAQALRFVRSARAINQDDVKGIYDEATVQALGGHSAEALQALQDAFAKGYSTKQAEDDPELTSLKGDPAFARLLAKFGGTGAGDK
jgi:tetratricopeptide (TPR) repeat protein/TolB-like protein/tRNA A-37 threonylcarbamoyl transferase component Bud32